MEGKIKYKDLIMAMMEHDKFDAHRIQRFMNVYCFARIIGEGEELSDALMDTLCISAITLDLGSSKEEDGLGEARTLLSGLGYSENIIDRVCYLIAHRRTYHDIDGMDYQALIEASFLVTMLEDGLDVPACRDIYERLFRTTTGKRICRRMYPVRES